MSGFTLGTMVAPPGVESVPALRRAVAAGLHGLWWPDHWMGWAPAAAWPDAGPITSVWPTPDLYADPFVEMVAIGATVAPALVGTAVTDVVRRHPAGLVQSCESVLRALPGTRLALGIGSGERANLEPYGLARAPLAHVAEALRVLRTMRDTGRVTFTGDHLTLHDAPTPAPLGRDRLSVWLGAHGPRMRALAATHADGWLPVGMTPGQIATALTTMRPPSAAPPNAATTASSPASSRTPTRTPDATVVRPPWTAGACVPVGVVSGTAERDRLCASPALKMLALSWAPALFTRAGFHHPLGDAVDPLRDFVPGHLTAERARGLVAQVPDDVVARFVRWGTPDELAAVFARYRAAGTDHLVAWEVTHLADPTRRAHSLDQLTTAWAALPPTP